MKRLLLALVVPVALLLTACSASPPAANYSSSDVATTQPSKSPSTTYAASSTLALLQSLPVKPTVSMKGYSRDQFGPAWQDVDHNGCDTRNDILNRDLQAKTWRVSTNDCIVLSGNYTEPYTGTHEVFTKSNADAIQIDHVVALGDAWQTGAQDLSATDRLDFANDPLELLAVDGKQNTIKSDSDAASWLPPNKAYQCSYVSRQVEVKAKYHLWVTPPEHTTMVSVLSACPDTHPTATSNA